MTSSTELRGRVRGWLARTTENAAGNALWAFVLLAAAWLASRIPAIKSWLSDDVFLPGWAFLTVLVAALGTGALIRLRRSVNSEVVSKLPETPIAAEPVPISFLAEPFEPDHLGTEVIALLRFTDGRWMTAEKIAQELETGSLQDVEQTVRSLEDRGWLVDRLTRGSPREYRLGDPGITYARERGMLTHEQKKRVDAQP